MDISTMVTKIRLRHHTNVIERNNVLNQLKLRSDSKAEEIAKKHTMIIIGDIFPRLGLDVKEVFNEEG